ncbi:MAG TPA: carbohydrate ABC transporter substrate-binding protein [Candidatus Acetothermia bacterium]|nr:carbohydrate ABC transporter substrate-binding protein [Candidatus Acetothermia bacterium]
MRKAMLVLLCLVVFAGVGFSQQKTVYVMHGWPGQQAVAFAKVVQAFMEAYPDINVVTEIVGRDRPAILATRLAAGNPPDVSPIPWLGLMAEWARAGYLVPLDGLVDVSEQIPALTPLGYVDGKLYGTWQSANVKSLVWYNVKAFVEKGYQVPTTWDELIALCDRIVADGGVPWSIGLESGAASGWPGTDWIEDIMLRTAGPEVYDQWVNHEIPWTDPAVVEAWEKFGQIALNPAYVLGGPVGALTTNFGDAGAPLFTDPPQAYLLKQATFIQSFILNQKPDLVPGEDFAVFPFPPIDPKFGTPVLGGGDVSVVFNTGGPLNGTREEVITFVQFLSSVKAQEIWARELGEMAANKNIDPVATYPDPIARAAWQMLLTADSFRYDGSDLMPGAVGAGSFWQGVLDYVSGVPLKTVLDYIESTAVDAYGY